MVDKQPGCSDLDQSLGIYEKMSANSDSPKPKEKATFNGFKVRVRSSKDPLIAAWGLSGKTGNFGLPSGDWIGIGVVLMIIAVYSLIQPAMYFLRKARGFEGSSRFIEFMDRKRQTIPGQQPV